MEIIDLDILAQTEESPELIELQDKIERRHLLSEVESRAREAAKERKIIDSEIHEFMESRQAETLISKGVQISQYKRRGAGKWDKDLLNSFLTPLQLEKAYAHGKEGTSLRSKDVDDE